MSKSYTNRPKEEFSVLSSPKIHKEIIQFCIEHRIRIYEATKMRMYNKSLEYLIWNGYMVEGASNSSDKEHIIITLDEFKEMFRTHGETDMPDHPKEINYSIF